MKNQGYKSKAKKFMFIILLMVSVFSLSVCASEVPYTSYTYWNNVGSEYVEVQSKPMYDVLDIITADSLNIQEFQSIEDICADEKGNIFVLDGKASTLVILNPDCTFKSIISEVQTEKGSLKFKKARGVFVKNEVIYVCDTENARVLLLNYDGYLLGEFLLPDSPIIPRDFIFKPVNVTVDNYGYTYILSDGSYYGALLFDSNNSFIGFYGSNSVESGVIGSISNAFNRIFANSKKKSATATVLPFAFNDICADYDGFIYTSTGFTNKNQSGQIKKLSPGVGDNILNSNSVNFVDNKVNSTFNVNSDIYQNIAAIDVFDDYIYALDSTYGRVFIYDQKCTLLSAFGGGLQSGTQKGTFVKASSICVVNSNVFVSDSNKNTITIFKRTDFGKEYMEARTLTLNGDYKSAENIWKNVLSQDSNCQLAYSGIALARLDEGDYSTALDYAKKGYDRETYALAFQELRSDWLSDNFSVLSIILILFVSLLVAFLIINKKKKYIVLNNKKIKLLFSTGIHPIDSYNSLQDKKLGSWKICLCITVLYFIVNISGSIYGGFAFAYYDVNTYNSFLVLLRSSGLIVLYITVNWLVSTLFSGRGKVKEIACVTCYSLLPLIFAGILSIILTNILIPSEGVFISILMSIARLYTLLLIAIGTIVIHEFDFKHFVGTTILTIIGMAIVVFILIMIWLLIQQLAVFLITVYKEIVM